MSTPNPTTYEEFWPYYVRAHRKRETRIIHAVGTVAFLSTVAAFAVTRKKSLLPLMPVVGYGPAWYSHFFVEGNVPATFGHPLWSLRADFEMCWKMLRGTMDAEVERCVAAEQENPAAVNPPSSEEHPTNGHGHDAPAEVYAAVERPFN